MSNATVIVTDRKTNRIVMSASDAQGKFSFVSLPAGEYEVKILKGGFEEYTAQQSLEAGRDVTQSFTLKVGSITEQVDVVARGKTGDKTPRLHLSGVVQAPKLIKQGSAHLSGECQVG